MQKVKISVVVKSARGSQSGTFESGLATAKTPATPLQTLIAVAVHVAQLAEIYEAEGGAVVRAVSEAIADLKDR